MIAYICDKCGSTISKFGSFPEGALAVAFSSTMTMSFTNVHAVYATLCPKCASEFAEWIGAEDLMKNSETEG